MFGPISFSFWYRVFNTEVLIYFISNFLFILRGLKELFAMCPREQILIIFPFQVFISFDVPVILFYLCHTKKEILSIKKGNINVISYSFLQKIMCSYRM